MSVIYRNSGAFNELDGIAIRISNLLYYGNFRESFAYYASENICNGDTNGKYIFGGRNLMILVLLYGVEVRYLRLVGKCLKMWKSVLLQIVSSQKQSYTLPTHFLR